MKRKIKSDNHQFHQYHQNEQSSLILTRSHAVGNPGFGFGIGTKVWRC